MFDHAKSRHKSRRRDDNFLGKMASSGVSWVVRQSFNRFILPQRASWLVKNSKVRIKSYKALLQIFFACKLILHNFIFMNNASENDIRVFLPISFNAVNRRHN